MELLADCSILTVGEYVTVPYAGKLLATLGATVTKVEPPEGDVARGVGPFYEDEAGVDHSQFFGYLNTGQRSITLPKDDEASADVLRDLIERERIDLVIEEDLADYGLDPTELVEDGVNVVSVSGFGQTGPFQEYEDAEIVAWAESGHMNKAGYPDSPPARPRIQTVGYWTGQLAAIAGVMTILDSTANDAPAQHVDLAKREAGVSSLERYTFYYSLDGETTQRTGFGYPSQGEEHPTSRTVYETSDGYVSAAVSGPRWETFCEEFLEQPELMEEERFATVEARRENRDQMFELAAEHLEDKEKWEMLEKFQEHGFPSAITSTPEDVAEFEHLQARDFWEEVTLPNGESVTMPGFPNLYDDERPEQERAPRLGEHNEEVFGPLGYEYVPSSATIRKADEPPSSTVADGAGVRTADEAGGAGAEQSLPLEGVQVLDFSWVYAGPHATRMMSALGADVVKVGSQNQFETSPSAQPNPYFVEMGVGKRSTTIDLNTERGRELMYDLVAESDVVVETYTPGYAERIGLDYERLKEVNEDVIYLSMPGWGKSGPARSFRAYGLNIQSMAGLDWLSGFPDDPPTTSGMSWPDPVNAYFALFSVLSALYRRERTGEGTYIQSPLLEVAVSQMHKPLSEYMNNDRMPERMGNQDEDRRFVQGAYPTAGEDRWVAIAIETDAQWERLCEAMDRPDLLEDDRFTSQAARLEHHDAVDEAIAEWTSERSREEVRSLLQRRDVPAGIVADEQDLIDRDPQLRTRDYFVTYDHPEIGEVTYQGFPFISSQYDLQYPSRPPVFGEHTEEVLQEWLGMSEEEVEAEDSEVLS